MGQRGEKGLERYPPLDGVMLDGRCHGVWGGWVLTFTEPHSKKDL